MDKPVNWIAVGWILTIVFGLIGTPLLFKYLFKALNKLEMIGFFFSVVMFALGIGLITGG